MSGEPTSRAVNVEWPSRLCVLLILGGAALQRCDDEPASRSGFSRCGLPPSFARPGRPEVCRPHVDRLCGPLPPQRLSGAAFCAVGAIAAGGLSTLPIGTGLPLLSNAACGVGAVVPAAFFS